MRGLMIILDRRLPVPLKAAWVPWLFKSSSSSRSVSGLQQLTLAFPVTPWRGMGQERRLDAVSFSNLQHTLLDGVEVVNADTAVHSARCQFQTLRKVTVRTSGKRWVGGGRPKGLFFFGGGGGGLLDGLIAGLLGCIRLNIA